MSGEVIVGNSAAAGAFADRCVVLPIPADHTAWLLQRRKGIGSSDCSSILGLNDYDGATAFGVWLDKTGQVPLSDADNEAMEWGRELEPVIRRKVAERLGRDIHLSPALQSIERPWQNYNPDGLFLDDEDDGPGLFEAKNTNHFLASQWADGQVPDHAELQVQHGMSVTGARWAIVAGLIGGNRLVIRRVERDDALVDIINREEAALWRHVLDRTEPPIVARENLAALVGAAGVADADELVLDEAAASEARFNATCYEQARLDEKRAQERKAEARNRLVWAARGHSRLLGPDGELIASLQRGVFSPKRFEADHPDEAALYMKKVEVVDSKALRAELPEMYRKYQAVSVRLPKEGK